MAEINKYFPNVMKEVREFKALAVAENPETGLIYDAIEKTLNNQFLETAEEHGVARMEAIVKIKPKATDTLEERKFKVLAKYNEDTPYTVKKLNELLVTLCGADGYKLEINNNNFSLKVKVALKSKKNKDAVEEMVERVAPMDMVVIVLLMYNQHQMLKAYTHAQLAQMTHLDIREEVLEIGN